MQYTHLLTKHNNAKKEHQWRMLAEWIKEKWANKLKRSDLKRLWLEREIKSSVCVCVIKETHMMEQRKASSISVKAVAMVTVAAKTQQQKLKHNEGTKWNFSSKKKNSLEEKGLTQKNCFDTHGVLLILRFLFIFTHWKKREILFTTFYAIALSCSACFHSHAIWK